jgi:coenzyme Q-binding protein COQ10
LPIKKVVKKFNFPKNDLIKLVLDIDDYKEFLPWCKSSKILKIDEDSIQKIIHADLEIGYKLITDTYTSEVVFDKKKSEIIVKSLSGPIKKLSNIWSFKDINESSCEVNFFIDIELNNLLLNAMFSKFFDIGFEKILSSFEDRAKNKLT